MTFTQWMHDRLSKSGMFDNQVDAVIDLVKTAPENKAMTQRWNDSIQDYPAPMINVLWVSVKRQALKYIDAECPQAWFRPLFTNEEVKQ